MYDSQRQCKRGVIGVTMPSNLKGDEHVLHLLFPQLCAAFGQFAARFCQVGWNGEPDNRDKF